MRKISFCIHVTYWKFISKKDNFVALLFYAFWCFLLLGLIFLLLLVGKNSSHSHTEAFLAFFEFSFRFSLFFSLSLFLQICTGVELFLFIYRFFFLLRFSATNRFFFSLSLTPYFIHILSDSSQMEKGKKKLKWQGVFI